MTMVMPRALADAVRSAFGALPHGTIEQAPLVMNQAPALLQATRPATKRGREVARVGDWWLHPTKGWRRG